MPLVTEEPEEGAEFALQVVGKSGFVSGPTLRDQLSERWARWAGRARGRRPVLMCRHLVLLKIVITRRLLLKRLVEVDLALGIHNPDDE